MYEESAPNVPLSADAPWRVRQRRLAGLLVRSRFSERLALTVMRYGTNPGMATLQAEQIGRIARNLLPGIL